MPDSSSIENDFIKQIKALINENISDENFGVSELANAIGMSRSNLLRKIKKSTNLSASQFIRQIRLQKAMELLHQSGLTVSEVSYQVGFGSTSYFIKCFGDHYGYPPGEAGKKTSTEPDSTPNNQPGKKKIIVVSGLVISLIVLAVLLFIVLNPLNKKNKQEKSIAVLPFINDSDDSSNVYIINGLMESVLNNLQKIEDLRVISRTSVEKYRNNPKTSSEIAKELNVRYFVEGSGQKIGDEILLNIQLIEAATDRHLLSEQYIRDSKDIFKLQQEVAKNIAAKVEAVILPEEEIQINKIPTEDLLAYDYFLKGLDLMQSGDYANLDPGISWFEKAIEQDPGFARAHAGIAISYFLKDAMFAEKQYSETINNYADKALLLDSKLPQSLIAKALYYMNIGENSEALPFLEKALEYNPNSALVINILSDYYTRIIPNTAKYLEYALKGVHLDIASHDSVTASYIYMHLSNAFIQTGFVDEAIKSINKSLEYNPNNSYSEYVKAFILYAKHRDFKKIKESLLAILDRDTNRIDVLQEVGKICYFMRDYESAYKYYSRFVEIREAQNLDIYRVENSKIAVVYDKAGHLNKSKQLMADFKEYAENDNSIYKHLNQTMYFAYSGDKEKALENLNLFTKETDYHYWILLFFEIDPLLDNIRKLPQFKKTLKQIEDNFWQNHNQIKKSLEEKGLL